MAFYTLHLKIVHPLNCKLFTTVPYFLLPDAFASGETEAQALRGRLRLRALFRISSLSVPCPRDCFASGGAVSSPVRSVGEGRPVLSQMHGTRPPTREPEAGG